MTDKKTPHSTKNNKKTNETVSAEELPIETTTSDNDALPVKAVENINSEKNAIKNTLPEYVVGVGASAGGLEAIELLFSNMPFKTNMAYVIVQHLSPDYKSMMDELLARKTMIPIKVAEDKMLIESDTIYLLPPKKEMIAANGRLYLTEREHSETVNLPINTFFRSLAETYQEKSIAIVLSGTGSDGSKGCIKVHDSGGFVIAQTPESCKFDSMPLNAIKTNKVDLVFRPESIPDALVKYSRRTNKVEQQFNLGEHDAEVSEFSEILIILNNRFDLDFSQYKPSTITRRLERRVSYQKSASLKDYINVLLTNKEELESLYYDLLIGVTQFFRDPGAFNSLRSMIPKMLKKFKDEPEIRIWNTACASGQEAYTMAIMMTEVMAKDIYGKKSFKIFATDIHNLSIQKAAAGIYYEDEIEGLSAEYREKYFKKLSDTKYQIIPEIRKCIVFAQHNLLKDPPFTRTHLVSCRNLLIYFNASAQQRVLSLLSFSLLNDGILFLGPSEAIGSHVSDFEVVDAENRLFRKTRTTDRPSSLPLTVRKLKPQREVLKTNPEHSEPKSLKSKKALEMLLQKYVPASILVDEQGNILHVFGDAGKYLSLNFGSASLNIMSLVEDEAKIILSQMLHRIGRTYKPISTSKVRGFNNIEHVNITMTILSESPSDLGYIIISLSESDATTTLEHDSPTEIEVDVLENITPQIELRIKELEDELIYAQESLQTTSEELESSNEELQASNEELMASNEELQSTNEELQSVNEELFSVNAEFQQKEVEREELMSDERSIIEELNLGIMFLDENLKIRKYSPMLSKLFNITEKDFGRPFVAAPGNIVKNIQSEVYNVFHGGELIEKEVEDENGLIYLVRINAYVPENSSDDSEDIVETQGCKGVVITLTNITKLYATQSALEKSQTRFNNTLNAVSDGYFEWTLETNDTFFSPSFYRQLGYNDVRPDLHELLADYIDTFKSNIEKQIATNQLKVEEALPLIDSSGNIYWMICKGELLIDDMRNQTKLIGIVIDFTKQKNTENKLQDQTIELERSNELLEKFAYIVSHDMKAPIRHIQNYLLFLKEAIESNDTQAIQEELKGIDDSATNLTELVDDVITYARVTSERKQLTDVDMKEIVDYVTKTMSPIIEAKNIHVETTNLPTLKGDKSLLTHLMQNLIGNACKYNDKASPIITVSCVSNKNNNVITITDNGIGFDQANANKIFDPFNRLVTKDEFEGSGIGLSICKTVVEQHKGKIRAESEIGKGSSFIVTLPIIQE